MVQKITRNMMARWSIPLILIIGFFSTAIQAASIKKCFPKTRRCVIHLTDGLVGDTVHVLDERAFVIAYGWIIRRQGSLALIGFKRISQTVKAGYPVIVQQDHSVRPYTRWANNKMFTSQK